MKQTLSQQPLARVQRIARAMRFIILFGMAFELTGVVALWLVVPWLQQILLPMLGLAPNAVTLTTGSRIIGFLLCLVPVGLTIALLVEGLRLFRDYARGIIFTTGACERLRRMAIKILLLALVNPLTRTLLILDLTFGNAPGHRMLTLGFTSDDYMLALFGGLLLAISWVMVEAARAVQENSEII